MTLKEALEEALFDEGFFHSTSNEVFWTDGYGEEPMQFHNAILPKDAEDIPRMILEFEKGHGPCGVRVSRALRAVLAKGEHYGKDAEGSMLP